MDQVIVHKALLSLGGPLQVLRLQETHDLQQCGYDYCVLPEYGVVLAKQPPTPVADKPLFVVLAVNGAKTPSFDIFVVPADAEIDAIQAAAMQEPDAESFLSLSLDDMRDLVRRLETLTTEEATRQLSQPKVVPTEVADASRCSLRTPPP